MRRSSLIYVCILVASCLLVGQLTILLKIIYPINRPISSCSKDLQTLLNITWKLEFFIFLIDVDILPFCNLKNQEEEDSSCICVDKKLFSFGILFFGYDQIENALSLLQDSGFYTVEFVTSPSQSSKEVLPTGFLLKRRSVIHLIVFHEREGNFWWHDSIVHDALARDKLSSMGLSFNDLQFMRTEGAVDKFETQMVGIHGMKFRVPQNVTTFLHEVKHSTFIECNNTQADNFNKMYGKDKTQEARRFAHKSWKILAITLTILNSLNIPFWLSSGTCLGYFRQCDIIPYSKDVDIGIFINDFSNEIIPNFIAHGFTLKHWFGKVNDSLELSFIKGELKLDIFFFYADNGVMWNGGTQARTGKKYKYIFPRFSLCWTEFLELKVRVPCETESYIKANYGSKWHIPITKWDWKSSPPNVRENGVWPRKEWSEVIKVY